QAADLRGAREEDPRRDRSQRDQQERPCGRRPPWRSAPDAGGAAPRRPAAYAEVLDRPDSGPAGGSGAPGRAVDPLGREALRPSRAARPLAADRWQGAGRDRRRAAPDVGGAVLQARAAALAHHLRWPGHHGFRAPRRDGRPLRPAGRRDLGGGRVPRRAGGLRLPDGAGEHGPARHDPPAAIRRGGYMSHDSAFAIPKGRSISQTLIVYVEDRPGTLNRIVSLFRRRGFNIDSLTVGRCERPGVSRITVVVRADDVTARRLEA